MSNKKFTDEDHEKEAARFRDYYNSEEGKLKEHQRRRDLTSRFSKARYDAKRRKSGAKEFTLTLEQYISLVSQRCTYCNCDMGEETGSGLDRIDNDKGYIPGNVSPCCGSCNRRRSKSMSAEEFLKQSILNGYFKK